MPPEAREATLSPQKVDAVSRGATAKGGDPALTLVLDRLTGGVVERPDAPDAWVTAVRRLPAREAQFAGEVAGIDDRLREVLRERGVQGFYTHQAAAIEHALGRRNVVITTPTASGKTLQPPPNTELGLEFFQDQLRQQHARGGMGRRAPEVGAGGPRGLRQSRREME